MLETRQYGTNNAALPLVMVHGFLCAGAFFRPNIAVLQRQHTVITVDLPGFGDSSDVEAVDSIAAMSEQVGDTLAAIGCERYHLLGHSMGGMVALQLALRAAARVQSLIVYASNSSGNLPDRFETFAESKKRLQNDFADSRRRICATWFVDGDKNPHFDLLLQCGARVSLATAKRAMDAMSAFDVSAEVGGITAPTLIISAALDKTYSPACQRLLARSMPHAQQRQMADCAHCANLEDEDAFNTILGTWLVTHR